jgi:hypothetical protein
MPAGDVQRIWFPEMLAELTNTWSSVMTWEELVDFCHRMMVKRVFAAGLKNLPR